MRGDEDVRGEPEVRGEAGERRRRVSRRGASDDRVAELLRARGADGGSAILETAGREAAIVLDEKRFDAPTPRQHRQVHHRSPADLKRRQYAFGIERQERQVTPEIVLG